MMLEILQAKPLIGEYMGRQFTIMTVAAIVVLLLIFFMVYRNKTKK